MTAAGTPRIGVITFPGSLDDRDAQRAILIAGAEPVALWHGSHDLEGVDALVLPGGFSYGDYLRAGAIAALAPIMAEVKDAADGGMPPGRFERGSARLPWQRTCLSSITAS